MSYDIEEIEHALTRFRDGGMSAQLRSLRMVPVHSGGTLQGERGEYGRWDKILARIESGETGIVRAGSRHNALLSWIGQMCNARLTLAAVRANFRIFAERAFEVSYFDDDRRDYETLFRGIDEFWHRIDSELDAIDAEVVSGLVEDDSAVVATTAQEERAAVDALSDPLVGRIHVEYAAPESALSFEPRPAGPSTIINFAVQAAKRCSDESEESWLSWLGACLNGANFFDAADAGTIGRLGKALQDRLEFVGALRRGKLCGPICSDDRRRAWSMSPLSAAQARIVVRHLFFTASELLAVKEIRNKVSAVASVTAAQKGGGSGKRKAKTVFAGKGELLTQIEREMMLRIESRVQFRESAGERGRVLAFQNGVYDLERWERICDEVVDPWDVGSADSSDGGALDGLLARLYEPWSVNPPTRPGELNPAVSWVRHENCAAVALGCPTRRMNGEIFQLFSFLGVSYGGTATNRKVATDPLAAGALDTPLFDRFLDDCFGDDAAAKSGVLLIIAYCLLPDNPLQRYFFFEGIGGSGKGTLATLISCIVGESNTGLVEIERIKSDAWLGPLEGTNLVIIDEAESSDPRSMRRVMHELARITGSHTVSARALHENAAKIRANWKFILISNEMPDAADKSGQQSRRAVPLYFGRKKESGVIPFLAQKIFEAEGDKIATKAVIEYLVRGVPRGERLFDVQSDAFTAGKKRFEESTGGLRGILKVFKPGEKNMPVMFVECICEIWIERKSGRDYLRKNLNKALIGEMAVLHFAHSERLRMPWVGVGGESDRVSGFTECGVDTEALLYELEMMPDELLAEIRDRTGRRQKLWLAAKALLAFSDGEFDKAEGRAPGQQSLF